MTTFDFVSAAGSICTFIGLGIALWQIRSDRAAIKALRVEIAALNVTVQTLETNLTTIQKTRIGSSAVHIAGGQSHITAHTISSHNAPPATKKPGGGT